ncbi:MAG TPA: metal-sensing transcriptional repressor [Anaerolineae bacterium]
MDEQTRQVVTQRLASAAGRIRAVERMAHEDACCLDMLRQIQAVQAALSKVSVMMLKAHLYACVVTAVRGADTAERERMLQEVMAVFEMSHKLNLSYSD